MEKLELQISQPEQGKFLQKIRWNREEIENAVRQITAQYEGLTYTEEQMQEAKKDRAQLNAIRTAISARRIEVKKALLAPYDEFEKSVKEVVALIDKPIEMIDEQTSEYERRIKEEKKDELEKFFDESVGDLKGTLTFDMVFNPKWLNKTSSLKSCKDDISEKIRFTETDMRTVEVMIEEKYRPYAKDFYFRNGRNISTALEEVSRMRAADRKAEEERLAREEAEERRREQEEAERMDTFINPPITENEKETEVQKEEPSAVSEPAQSEKNAPDADEQGDSEKIADRCEDTKIYKASFTIRGTKSQILSVKEFMLTNNITFGRVEK